MTQKQMFQLPIGPGQYTEQSERGAVGRWFSMDKVRFRKGLAEKIGGWMRLQAQFLGTCRRLKDWTSLDSKKWSCVATDTKLYLWQDGILFDITPLRDSGTLTNPFDTTNTSDTVVVNDSNHGCQVGDYVRFLNATAVGGITIDGEYQVTSIVDNNAYRILHTSAATSTVVGGGGTVDFEYDISAGAASAVTATGYGTGPYGREGYGNARTGSTLVLNIRTWSLDTWGEDLLASPRGGAIYWWDRSKGTGQRAVALGGDAPPNNEYMLVSQRDRHVLALGAFDYFNNAFDPMLIRWSSTEDLNDWVPTSTNTSGDLRLYSGSKIVAGVRSRLESVIFTDVSVHTLPFVGGFNVFGLNIVGENVSILGPNCAVPVDHRVLFMAESDFYIYDGIVKVMPCDVRNFVYDNLNVSQKDKIYGGLNREFNEVWWFYPSYDPNSWVQDDFSLTIPAGYEPANNSGPGATGYLYGFNSTGFTEVTATADTNYEHDYFLTNDEPILTPEESEYAIELDVNPAIGTVSGALLDPFDTTDTSATVVVNHVSHGTQIGDSATFSNATAVGGITIDGTYTVASLVDGNAYRITHTSSATSTVSGGGGDVNYVYDIAANYVGRAGMCFLRTDLTGADGTDADDCQQLMFELNYDGDRVEVWKKTAAGVAAPTNQGANTVDFTTLTGFTMALGTKYILTAQFDTPTLTLYVDGVQAFQFDLDVTELVDYVSGTAGLHQAPGVTDDLYRFYNFAIGPVGSLTASDFDISPVEVNRYVALNYEEGSWTTGKMARTAWADRSPLLEKPYAASADGYLYQHETGADDNGAAMASFIQSFDMEIPDVGEELMHVDQLIPDFLTLEGSVDVHLSGRKYPQSPTRIEKGPYTVSTGTRKISTRIRARQIALRVESNDTGDRWRMGNWRGRAGAHGKRG